MTVEEFFRLPEAPPIKVKGPPGLGQAPLKAEGEHYVPPWRSHDGRHWWTIDGGTRRQTYEYEDDL